MAPQSKVNDLYGRLKHDLENTKYDTLAEYLGYFCNATHLAISEQEEYINDNPEVLQRIKPDS